MLLKKANASSQNRKLIFGILYSVLVLFFGAYLSKTGVIGNVLKPAIFDSTRIFKNFCKGLTADPKRLSIDIKYIDYQKLAYKREIALADGVLFTDSEDYVPAVVRYQNKTVKTEIRLKGDWTDQLQGDKWSFRIRVTRGNTIFGMRQFSLHAPEARMYIHEWIYHAMLKREGILSLRYDFVRVTLNGKDLGVYALEEHFDKQLIEYNKLREGPIVRFNEDLLWRLILNMKNIGFNSIEPWQINPYLSSDIDTFHTNKILSSPPLFLQYTKAVNLLESFRRGILKTSDVFNVRQLATYFALTDLLGAEHGSRWHNARFYYNPITSRLEPIGFDAYAGRATEMLCATTHVGDGVFISGHYNMVFSDVTFCKEYMKALERVSDKAYLDDFFEDIDDKIERNINIIYSDFPAYDFSKDNYYRNQKYIKSILNPPKGIHAYYKNHSDDKIEISLGNIQLIPVEVLSISYDGKTLSQLEKPILLPATNPKAPVEYVDISFSFPEGFKLYDLPVRKMDVNYRLLGTSKIRKVELFPWPYLSEKFIEEDVIRHEPNADTFKFIYTDNENKTINIVPGDWNIEKNLIVPAGYKLVCTQSTKLNLINSAGIISFSMLEFIGTEENPVIICSEDSTGQGIVVINSDRESILDNVIFENLSNISQSGWALSGAVTFYESPVQIYHCQFLNNKAEDGLTISRSDFSINKSIFKKNSFDAFDSDFSKGEIADVSFVDCGNDAIDVSGSNVKLTNVFINNTGDKGLSVGENSKMAADKVEIKNAKIAIASKDMSVLAINDIKISNCEIGLAVYQKKSEFGPASIVATGLVKYKINIPYFVEEGSELNIEGKRVESSQTSIKLVLQ